jgi:hypothetical protein
MASQAEVLQVWSYWQTIMASPRSKLDVKREKSIRDRLNDGYSVEDLMLACRGCAVSEFHQGVNDRKCQYNSITLICRDADHLERFMGMGETADRLLAQMVERAERPVNQLPDLPAPPSPEQIARARELMRSVKRPSMH